MSTESEKAAPALRLGARAERPPASRLEAQLHVRVGELQAQLAEVTRCLADAENRASELLSVREQAKQLESQLAVTAASAAAAAEAAERAAAEAAESRASELFALSERVNDLETQLAAATAAATGSEDARRDLERKLAVITASRSWRMTKPLRAGMRRMRQLLRV